VTGAPETPSDGKHPVVTIVITTYNHARYLDEAITSALAQEGDGIEVLVIDDGSSDDPGSVVSKYPGVRLVSQPNQGLSAARNAGTREARGRFVQFLDADDRLLPGAVASNLAVFGQRPDCAMVHGSYRSVASDWTPIWQPRPFVIGENALLDLLVRGNRIGMHATVMYRRDSLLEVGGFDPSLPANEDYDLYLRLASVGRIASHPAIIAEYRYHDANMSRDAGLMLSSALHVLDKQRARATGPAVAQAIQRGERHMRSYWIRAQLRQAAGAVRTGRGVIPGLKATAGIAARFPGAFAAVIGTLVTEVVHGRRSDD
jgi:hypothetical protein